MMPAIDYLSARGLGEFTPMAGEGAGLVETIRASVPTDYPARVRALELACQVVFIENERRPALITDLAAAFHAFLMGAAP